MGIFKLHSDFAMSGDQPTATKTLVNGFQHQQRRQTLLGVTGSGKTFTMANIIAALDLPVLILSHNKTLTAQLYNEFKDFFPENAVEYFVSYYDYYQPESYVVATDTYIEKEAQINEKLEQMRLSATMALATRKDVILVSSISCIYGLGDPEEFKSLSARFSVGQKISRSDIIALFLQIQYERNDTDLKSGRFRVRGDVIDVIPGYARNIIRISLFGNEIETIEEFSFPDTKRLFTYDSYVLFPARHYVLPQEKINQALQDIENELEARLPELGMVEAHRLRQRTKYDLEMIKEMGYCTGIENYSRHFEKRPAGKPPFTLIDFFPKEFLLIVDESHVTIPQIHGMYKGDRARKTNLIEHGFRLPSAYDNRPLMFDELDKKLHDVLYVSATPSEYELKVSSQVAEQLVRPTGLVDPPIIVKPSTGQMQDLLEQIEQVKKLGFRTLVTTLTKRMAENLSEFLSKQKVKVRYLHSEIETLERNEIIRQLRLGTFDVLVGINLLREGLDIPEVALVAILDADKEGFLRDARSLIQTAGRAARNVDGRVIFYADTVTRSMRTAMDEINRRRVKQLEYNRVHGIVPKTIIKAIREEVTKIKDIKHIPKAEIPSIIEELQIQMDQASEELNFEKAIEIRDRISKLKERITVDDSDA